MLDFKKLRLIFDEGKIAELRDISSKVQTSYDKNYYEFVKNQIFSHDLISFLYRLFLLTDYKSFKEFIDDVLGQYYRQEEK